MPTIISSLSILQYIANITIYQMVLYGINVITFIASTMATVSYFQILVIAHALLN
jgi:hypothetical protein